MKKFILISSILFCVSLLHAQSWVSSLQITSSSDVLEHVSVIDDDGNIFTYGSFEGTLTLPDGNAITSYGCYR